MQWLKKVNFNINVYNINNIKMRKVFLRVSHASLLKRFTKKQWTVCLNVWQKLQSRKNEICNPKIQHKSSDSIKTLFKVLSPVANAHPQPWVPLIDGFVDNAVLQLSPDGDEALHW